MSPRAGADLGWCSGQAWTLGGTPDKGTGGEQVLRMKATGTGEGQNQGSHGMRGWADGERKGTAKLQQGCVIQSEGSGVGMSGMREKASERGLNAVSCNLLHSIEVLAHSLASGAAGCGHSQLPQM